jgi:hypothetical protein
VEAKHAMTARASEEEGFVPSCRRMLRQLGQIFAQAHSAAHAQRRLQQLRQDSHALGDPQLEKMPQFFADHWEQACRSLRKKGMGKPRRGANAASGRRLRRRLEQNHDGIQSAATRQHYMQI